MKRNAFALCTVLLGLMWGISRGHGDPKDGKEQSQDEASRRVGDHHKKSAKNDYEIPSAGSQDKEGRPLLSWRVKILPQLGYRNLYEAFHHDEPWDSPHNRKLIGKMPRIYRTAVNVPQGKTTVVALVSPNSAITSERGGIRLSQVTDGASNTILFVRADADHAVTWSKPDDIDFDPKNPFQGLEGTGRFQAVMVDGSVQTIPTSIGKETMKRLVYRNDGKPVTRP